MNPGWLSTLQAAKRLGLDRCYVSRLIRQGRLPAVRVGISHYRVHVDVVEAHLAKREASR